MRITTSVIQLRRTVCPVLGRAPRQGSRMRKLRGCALAVWLFCLLPMFSLGAEIEPGFLHSELGRDPLSSQFLLPRAFKSHAALILPALKVDLATDKPDFGPKRVAFGRP